jgi:hypothetical protein
VSEPDTAREVNVPTLVIFGCADPKTTLALFEVSALVANDAVPAEVADVAVVAVVAVVAEVAVAALPAVVAYVALATVPVTFAPGTLVNPKPLPIKRPAVVVMLPLTVKLVNVPTLVILGCAAVVTVAAVFAVPVGAQDKFPDPSVERTKPDEPPAIFKFAIAPKDTFGPVNDALPDTTSELRVPRLVMLGWALPVTVIAVVAAPAEAQLNPPTPSVVRTYPAEPPVILRLPTVPKLTNCPVNCALPETVKFANVPKLVMFG